MSTQKAGMNTDHSHITYCFNDAFNLAECRPIDAMFPFLVFSCVMGDTKVFLLSFFKLMADVQALFIIWDPVQGDVVK